LLVLGTDNRCVRTRKEEGLASVVSPPDDVRRLSISVAELEHFALPVGLTHPMPTDHDPISHLRVHAGSLVSRIFRSRASLGDRTTTRAEGPNDVESVSNVTIGPTRSGSDGKGWRAEGPRIEEAMMALTHRHTDSADGIDFGWLDRWQWPFQFENGDRWLRFRVEEFHDGDMLVVRVELPDIDPDKDVEIFTDDGVVRIHAHREEKNERKGKRGYRSEFRYGEFERQIAVPKATTAEDVKATYHDGILEVRIPCAETTEATNTKVPVTRT
jgi:HSP20 family protein